MTTQLKLRAAIGPAVLAGVLGTAVLTALAQDQPAAQGRQQTQSVEQLTADWPEAAKKAAGEMTKKYGPLDGMTPDRIVWTNKAPWKEIILSKHEVPHHFPIKHTDVLEQVIDYKVPPDKFDDLAEFDGSVIVERTKGTMSARCDKEAANFLALNLAHDIVTGKRSVEEAREFYAKTVAAMMKGEMHPYVQKLQFEVPKDAGDPDHPVKK